MKDNHTPELCRHHHPRYYYGDAEMITVPHPARVAGKIIASYMEPDNARLFSGAWNSYHKNCGDRAVECAEGDLLGEALDALKAHSLIMADIHFAMGNAIINNTDLDADLRTLFHGEKTRDREVAISAILAKRKGDTA